MKAEELMIGDWVSCDGSPRKVVAIAGDHIGVRKTTEMGLPYVENWQLGKVHPIPLTTEMLDKNGFRFDSDGLRWQSGEFAVDYGHDVSEDVDDYLFVWISNRIVPLRHVHQFQHALRLSGVDPGITL